MEKCYVRYFFYFGVRRYCREFVFYLIKLFGGKWERREVESKLVIFRFLGG